MSHVATAEVTRFRAMPSSSTIAYRRRRSRWQEQGERDAELEPLVNRQEKL